MKPNEKINIKLDGLSCASCAQKIEEILKKKNGIIEISVNFATSSLSAEYNPNLITLEEIKNNVIDLGYRVSEPSSNAEDPKMLEDLEYLIFLKRFFVSFILTLSIILISFLFHSHNLKINIVIAIMASIVQFWCGLPFYKASFHMLKYKTLDMNSLIVLGTSSAYLFSIYLVFAAFLNPEIFNKLGGHLYFDTSSVIITLILLGRFIEGRAKNKTKESLKELLEYAPKTAVVLENGNEKVINIEFLKKGDILVVRAGEKIPVDGIIESGFTGIDEGMITGESKYAEKEKGKKVFAGTINISDIITVKAEKVGKETMLSEIARMVNEAVSQKAPIQNLADRIAGVFVPLVISFAVITFIIWSFMKFDGHMLLAFRNFVSVLIVSCPCALGLAVPAAVVVGFGVSAKKGILIKNPSVLEKINSANTIVFDKTGTLTLGLPNVTDVILVNKKFLKSEDELMGYAAGLEKNIIHPLSKAILAYCEKEDIKPSEVKNTKVILGLGASGVIEGRDVIIGSNRFFEREKLSLKDLTYNISDLEVEGKTVVFIAVNDSIEGIIAIADTIRNEASAVIKDLIKMNFEIWMLTGDTETTAKNIAQKAGIENIISGVLPSSKAEKIKELKAENKVVIMVGDGINDAPSLAEADIGISLSRGADIAKEASGITLLSNNLFDIIKAIKIGKGIMGVIKQNLFWSFIYNIISIPLAAGVLYPFGFLLNPVFCAFLMTISSLFVVFNSLRLRYINV